jgi:hypothetical protein
MRLVTPVLVAGVRAGDERGAREPEDEPRSARRPADGQARRRARQRAGLADDRRVRREADRVPGGSRSARTAVVARPGVDDLAEDGQRR